MSERDSCPVLYGRLVTLEPLVAAHAADLFPLLSDSELWRYEDDGAPRSAVALKARYAAWQTRRSPDGTQRWLNWAVRVAPQGIVGNVQATVYDDSLEAAVGYMLGRRFWSNGWGTDAIGAVIAHLRDGLRLRRVLAVVDDRNAASLRLLEKLGFVLDDSSDRRNLVFVLKLAPAGERGAGASA